MLRLQQFTFNPFSENTYVLHDEEGSCWVVDPGMSHSGEERELKNWLEKNALAPKGIINTHAHVDHVLGVTWMVDRYGLPFYLHSDEATVLAGAPGLAMMFGIRMEPISAAPIWLDMDTPLMLGKEALKLLPVPGHSPGSVALYYEAGGWVIGGDALFAGSIGRVDLPGGDMNTLLLSIKSQMFTLPPETVVYPGHGPATTISEEMSTNPYFN